MLLADWPVLCGVAAEIMIESLPGWPDVKLTSRKRQVPACFRFDDEAELRGPEEPYIYAVVLCVA